MKDKSEEKNISWDTVKDFILIIILGLLWEFGLEMIVIMIIFSIILGIHRKIQ